MHPRVGGSWSPGGIDYWLEASTRPYSNPLLTPPSSRYLPGRGLTVIKSTTLLATSHFRQMPCDIPPVPCSSPVPIRYSRTMYSVLRLYALPRSPCTHSTHLTGISFGPVSSPPPLLQVASTATTRPRRATACLSVVRAVPRSPPSARGSGTTHGSFKAGAGNTVSGLDDTDVISEWEKVQSIVRRVGSQ